MTRIFVVIASVALAGTIGVASSAQASVQAKKKPSPTVTACNLAYKYGQHMDQITGGPAAVQAFYLSGSIKVVRAFKGKVPELLKPNETALVNDIAAGGDILATSGDLNALILTCNNTGVLHLTQGQIADVQTATATQSP
jgi:hypothetical protein